MNNSTRLVELDFFRGAALLIIFWDHLHWFTGFGFPLHYGFSDAAAVFVFLSGYVSGLVYWRVYKQKGLSGVVLKSVKRAAQIYSVHLIAVVLLLGIALLTPVTIQNNPMHSFLNFFSQDLFGNTLRIVSLQYFPDLFDILPLYIILVLLIPGIIYLIGKDWRTCFAIVFILYSATQLIPPINMQFYFPSWTFNPLSWLFLFAAAMIISINIRERSFSIPLKPFYAGMAFIVLSYSFLNLKTVNQLLNNIGILPDNLMFLFPSPFPLIEKGTLQPVSLIHFLSLAYLVSIFIPYIRKLFNNIFAYPLAACGQNSLVIFSFGIVLTYLITYLIIILEVNQLIFYTFSLGGWAITIKSGLALSNKRNRTRSVINQDIVNQRSNINRSDLEKKELKKVQNF